MHMQVGSTAAQGRWKFCSALLHTHLVPCTRIQPSIIITTLHTPPLTLSHPTKPCCTLPHHPAFHTLNARLLTSHTFPPLIASSPLVCPDYLSHIHGHTHAPSHILLQPRNSHFALIPRDYPHTNRCMPGVFSGFRAGCNRICMRVKDSTYRQDIPTLPEPLPTLSLLNTPAHMPSVDFLTLFVGE